MKGDINMKEPTIKISLEAYQELVLRKIDTDVPITKQIDKLLGVNQDKKKRK